MIYIYRLTHDYEDDNGYEIVTDIGVFSSMKKAQMALKKLENLPQFSIKKDGFLIEKYEINKHFWLEGFVENTEDGFVC